MNENYVKDQTEIDLRQLFWAILRRWRMVLCWMLAVAVVAGAFKTVSAVRSLRSAAETAAAQQTEEELSQEKNDVLERLNAAAAAIEEREAYEKESRYMAIDPYNVAVAKQTYYIKADYQIRPDNAFQTPDYTDAIVNAYVQVLTGDSILQAVAEECDIEPRYLSELVSASNDDAGILTVRVIAGDLEEAEKILALLDDSMDDSRELIASMIDEHAITKLSYNACTTVDVSLAKAQSAKKDALEKASTEQETRYEALKTEYESLGTPLAGGMGGAVKSGVKMAIIGAIIGLVIACAIVCVQVAVSDRVYSADSLTQRMRIHILGALPADTAKTAAMGKLDRKLRAKAGLSIANDAAAVYAAAASYLTLAYPEANTVLVAGGAEETRIQAACEALQSILPEKKILSGGCILPDADTIRKVGQSDVTVLVEHTGVSSYSGVIREVETVQSLKGTLAGALVIED